MLLLLMVGFDMLILILGTLAGAAVVSGVDISIFPSMVLVISDSVGTTAAVVGAIQDSSRFSSVSSTKQYSSSGTSFGSSFILRADSRPGSSLIFTPPGSDSAEFIASGLLYVSAGSSFIRTICKALLGSSMFPPVELCTVVS